MKVQIRVFHRGARPHRDENLNSTQYYTWEKIINSSSRESVTEGDKGWKIVHSQQLCPQDHLHLFTRVVAPETQLEKVVGAALPRAQHAGRAPDRRQVEILRLAGAYPDLIPQSVVDHAVALVTDREREVV